MRQVRAMVMALLLAAGTLCGTLAIQGHGPALRPTAHRLADVVNPPGPHGAPVR